MYVGLIVQIPDITFCAEICPIVKHKVITKISQDIREIGLIYRYNNVN